MAQHSFGTLYVVSPHKSTLLLLLFVPEPGFKIYKGKKLCTLWMREQNDKANAAKVKFYPWGTAFQLFLVWAFF